MEGCPSFWGLAVRYETSANFPVANLYTMTSMDSAVDLTTCILMEAVVTAGVGAVGVGLVGMGWTSTLTLYLLLASMVLLLLSLVLGSWGFPGHGVGI